VDGVHFSSSTAKLLAKEIETKIKKFSKTDANSKFAFSIDKLYSKST
jgi:hypothetical protein